MRFYTQITALLSCNLCMLSGKDTSLSDFSCQKKSGIKNMLQKKGGSIHEQAAKTHCQAFQR